MDTPTATIDRWLHPFDDRMRTHIEFCRHYEQTFSHGAPGHLDFQTISRLAGCLEEATGMIERVERALQTDPAAVRELLAAYAHDAWSGWMEYLFTQSGGNQTNGTVSIPAELVERWRRQMTTAYPSLPDHEQESDRKEADRMLTIVREAVRAAR